MNDINRELTEAKAQAIASGWKSDDFRAWEIRMNVKLRDIGFDSRDDVRRVAIENGRFVKW